MDNTLELLVAEIKDMDSRYGPADPTPQSVYFHTTRAKGTLDEVVLSRAPLLEDIAERCTHLAAVLMRFARELYAESDDMCEQP